MRNFLNRKAFQIVMLATLLLLPFILFTIYGIQHNHEYLIPYAVTLAIFLFVAALISEVTKKIRPGKEDYISCPPHFKLYFAGSL